MIRTLAELAQPDEASLAIRPFDIDEANVAEEVAESGSVSWLDTS